MNQSTSTVTQKGQVTIPIKLRQKFNFNTNSKVRISEGKNFVKIESVKDISSLAGSLRKLNQRSITIKQLREIRKNGLIFKGKSK